MTDPRRIPAERLAEIKAARAKGDGRVREIELLGHIAAVETDLSQANQCILWNTPYPREAELLTECRKQEERAEAAERAATCGCRGIPGGPSRARLRGLSAARRAEEAAVTYVIGFFLGIVVSSIALCILARILWSVVWSIISWRK